MCAVFAILLILVETYLFRYKSTRKRIGCWLQCDITFFKYSYWFSPHLLIILLLFYFSDDGIVVGYAAAAQAEHNAANTIYDAKRFIGKHFSKDELASEAKRYAFEVSTDIDI